MSKPDTRRCSKRRNDTYLYIVMVHNRIAPCFTVAQEVLQVAFGWIAQEAYNILVALLVRLVSYETPSVNTCIASENPHT